MWREASEGIPADTESEIGQLMLYLIAAHFRRFSVIKRGDIPTPILGIYMKDMKVSM